MKEKRVNFHDYIGKRVFLIGIGGSSMAGLAQILQARGCLVSGSDRSDSAALDRLRKAGIPVTVGHSASNVEGADLVVYTSAIPDDHVERVACARLGIPTLERSELLGQLSEDYGVAVSVCGTHGKTTVTSMLAQILVETSADPTVHIGGVLDAIGGSIRMGSSDLFLTEACEFRRSFLKLHTTHAVVLNIAADHLDCYRDIDEIEETFGKFLSQLPADGWALGSGEDPRVVRQLAKLSCPHATFGAQEGCDYRMVNAVEDAHGYFSFDFAHNGTVLGHVSLSVPGLFNAKNAVAALATAHRLGLDTAAACEVVGRFTGAHRRFELTGTLNGAELFHDYGHNPEEMRNALSIARKRCDHGRLWAVMQPHTYSRVKTLFDEYLTCTEEADITLVTDIYAAREKDPGDINTGMLVEGMRAHGIDARWTPSFDDTAAAIREGAREGDLVITMGCGNINLLNDMLNP